MVDLNSVGGIGAYQKALEQAAGNVSGGASSGLKSAGPSFEDILSRSVDAVAKPTANAEITAMQHLTNEADLLDVVTAVNNAEVAVQTVVAVRDKVIQAYNDIIRLPI